MDPDAPQPQSKEMTVGDLIAVLSELPPDTLVVMSRDEEGNGFSPLYEVSPCVYVPNQWNDGSFATSGEIEETDEDDEGEIPSLKMPGAVKAICLWPGN